MKKIVGIILAALVLALTLTFVVACNPDEPVEPPTPSQDKYTITFDSKGGDEVESITAEAGSDISELLPADPTKTNLFFGGWSIEDKGFASQVAELPQTMPSEDVTYYAKWVRHAVIEPMLQSLDENGVPVADRDKYVPAPELSLTVDVDPDSPTVDLYSHRPSVRGFFDNSTAEEHQITVDFKEKTVQLYYDRSSYNVSFNLNNLSIAGNMEQVRLYFGQKFVLPDIPATIALPINLRLSGWLNDYESDDPIFCGEEITVGEEGGLIDGSSSSVTLFATYDKGYVDYSTGDDYVFLPASDEGVAIIRRAGFLEFFGEYYKNTNKSEEAPQIGEFFVYTDAGTVLNGYVYEDGHFAYKQNLPVELKGQTFGGYSAEQGRLEGTTLKLVDLYGYAILTLAEPLTLKTINSSYDFVYETLEAGEYVGGYWVDGSAEDLCFSLTREVGTEELQFDMHFQIGTINNAAQSEDVFRIRGAEAGIFCEGITSEGYADGDIVLLDGYGNALLAIGNSEYQGAYVRVGDNTYLATGVNSNNQLREMLVRPDLDTVYGDNMGLYVGTYEKGDSTLLANCENEDGSRFEADGFGNGVYTPASGAPIQGKVTLAENAMFDETTPAVAYTLRASNNSYSVIVDQTSRDGNFVLLDGDVQIEYLYGASQLVDDYVGAMVRAGKRAFYLTAAQTAYGNVAFGDIVEGTVNDSVFQSKEYIFTFAADAERTTNNGVPTISTNQFKLNEITFDVKDDQGKEAAGKLTVKAAGTATYEGTDGFNDAQYEFSYSSVIVKTGESNRVFIVDSFETKIAFIPVEMQLNVADEGLMAKLYEFNDGENRSAVVWRYNDDELYFYAMAGISETDDDEANPLDGGQVYIIDTPYESMYAIKEGDGYLVPNSLLLYGEYTLNNGNDTLELDGYGHAKYTVAGATEADNKTYNGTYGVVEGVYRVQFTGEGAPEAFKFMPLSSGYRFQKVDYSEFFVVNPFNLNVSYVMRITGDSAAIYNATETSDGNVSMETTPASEGTISQKEGDIYTFAGNDGRTFDFCYNETIFVQKVIIMKNSNLPDGTFSESDSKNITLDQFGRATYNDGEGNSYQGYYYSISGMYGFFATGGGAEIRFTLDLAEKILYVYDPNPKPLVSGNYDLTLDGEAHSLQIDFEAKTATLFKGEDPIATDGELDVTSDGVYTFDATNAEQKPYHIVFIISRNKLVQYSSELSFTRQILTGNLYLYDMGATAIEGDPIVMNAGTLTVKGFLEIAELTTASGTTIKGSIQIENSGDILFVDAQGNSQLLAQRTYNGVKYLGAYGVEMGPAVYFYITMQASSITPEVYFDGMGMAYNVNSNGEPTTRRGYYYFGQDPYSIEETSDDYIIVGDIVEGQQAGFDIIAAYNTYSLSRTEADGSVTYVTGLVMYDATRNAVALADDGSLFVFDGYDGVTYYDGVGVGHNGYFNNYGLMYGEADNRYVVMNTNQDVMLYFIYFDGEKDENGYVRARRSSYLINVDQPYEDEGVAAEVQIVYEEDFADMSNEPFEKGKDGYAIVLLLLGTQEVYYAGFFTLEDGYMYIEVELTDGTTDIIELELFVDGSADWHNIDDWLTIL